MGTERHSIKTLLSVAGIMAAMSSAVREACALRDTV